MAAIPCSSQSKNLPLLTRTSLCFLVPSSGQWHLLIFYFLFNNFYICFSTRASKSTLFVLIYMSRCTDVQIIVRYIYEIILTANLMKCVEMLTTSWNTKKNGRTFIDLVSFVMLCSNCVHLGLKSLHVLFVEILV